MIFNFQDRRLLPGWRAFDGDGNEIKDPCRIIDTDTGDIYYQDQPPELATDSYGEEQVVVHYRRVKPPITMWLGDFVVLGPPDRLPVESHP